MTDKKSVRELAQRFIEYRDGLHLRSLRLQGDDTEGKIREYLSKRPPENGEDIVNAINNGEYEGDGFDKLISKYFETKQVADWHAACIAADRYIEPIIQGKRAWMRGHPLEFCPFLEDDAENFWAYSSWRAGWVMEDREYYSWPSNRAERDKGG